MTRLPMKEWRYEAALQLGLTSRTVENYLYAGKLFWPPFERAGRRTFFALSREVRQPDWRARPGELRLSQWLRQEASLTGRKPIAVWKALRAGRYPAAKIRKCNRRVHFISFPTQKPKTKGQNERSKTIPAG